MTAGTAARARTRLVDRRRRARFGGWLVLAVVLVGGLAFGTLDDGGPTTRGERARNLAGSVACPQCDGQSVADSDSDASDFIRARIDERIEAGASDAQIRDELAAAYGEDVLLTPGQSGVSSLVWSLPVVVLVAAVAGLAFAFLRWRGGGAARATPADHELVASARADTRPSDGDSDGDGASARGSA